MEVHESQLFMSRLTLLFLIMLDMRTSVACTMAPWMFLLPGLFAYDSLPWSLRAISLLLIEFDSIGCMMVFLDFFAAEGGSLGLTWTF